MSRDGWSATLVKTKIDTGILIPSLFAAFALLIVTRALAIYISRKSIGAEKSITDISKLDFFPLNTPGEAIKSAKAFYRAFLDKPKSLTGIVAGIHLLLWLTLVLIIIFFSFTK